ncbi:MAG: peptidoglycan DD-metalloendopeptidase family protein [Acidobacteria bacterium]|nr:peptidoglycan DD-metalloendopeptidase family protein [Acidobacteriota bacterium]
MNSAAQGLKLDGAEGQTNDGPTAEQAERIDRMIAEFEARYVGSEVKRRADALAAGVAAGPQPYTFHPQAGNLWQDLFMNNFVDLDPGGGFKDFDCSGYTLNGHKGHDSDIDSFKRQEIGVPIFAALDGMVVDAHDGEFDMNTTGPNVPANYVVLWHGDGHYALYWHMKKGSVAVSLNQFVPAGTQIGQTGSSGISTGPHLHFESIYAGTFYEPYAGPCRPGASNWASQIPIRRGSYARDFVVSDAPFSGQAGLPYDEAVRTGSFVTGLRTVFFRVLLGGDMPANLSHRVRFRRPDGTIALDSPGNLGNGSPFRGGWLTFGHNISFNVTGTWHILFDLNGQPVAEAPLTVVASADQIVNRPPNPITAAIDASSANPPTPADVLFCRVNTSLVNEDPDYDIVRYRYQWRVNGALVRDVTSAALSDALPSRSTHLDDIVSCSVTPSDGKVPGYEIGASIQIGAPPLNPIDDARTFVRQHYLDFLGREADPSGLAFWTGEIENCGADVQCREVKRVNVSAAFFLSIEFQNTGYLVERMYKVAYGDRTETSTNLVVPSVTRAEFMQDTPLISAGVVVGVGEWAKTLESNKVAYTQTFVQRQRFTDVYGALTPEQFVDRLNQNAGGVLTGDERAGLLAELTANNTVAGRASVLRKVAENAELDRREKNRAFVLMEYFGYLRRNPSDAPEVGLNYAGWNFWLSKLNEFGGNYIEAEMVKAFLSADEYRKRFGQ